MTVRYITIPYHLVRQKYPIQLGEIRVNKSNQSLVYDLNTDKYTLRGSPMYSTNTVLICTSEEDFIQTIEQHKLIGIL